MAIYKPNQKRKWLPKTYNQGWVYCERINHIDNKKSLVDFLSSKYKHSSSEVWEKRLADGQIKINYKTVNDNQILHVQDLIHWNRPPWEEPGVPASWDVVFDNGDVLVINKPSGLPTTPGGGFLKHTLSAMLDLKYKKENDYSIPKPIHRLGRYTSGLILCARKKKTRNALCALFREQNKREMFFQRIYRGLAISNSILNSSNSIKIESPISKHSHPFLGEIWNTDSQQTQMLNLKEIQNTKLSALTKIKLLERRESEDLLEISIHTGRPHQIRIHLASIGTPLIGDPLYIGNGKLSRNALPGQGGYLLHSYQLINIPIDNKMYSFEAPLPKKLKRATHD